MPLLSSIDRFASLGDRPTDSDVERVRHRFLVYMAVLMSCGGLLWGTLLLVFRLPWPATIPFGYVLGTVFNLSYFAATKNFPAVRFVQVLLSLALPFMLQWTLGGFGNSGAVMLWAMLALLATLTFSEATSTWKWLTLYCVLTIGSGIADAQLADRTIFVTTEGAQTVFYVTNIVIITSIVFALMLYLLSQRERALFKQARLRDQVDAAEDRADEAAKKARRMGSYRLERKLGEGGMGEVWMARHRLLARPAAIKLIRAEALDGDEQRAEVLLRRFEREAQATASLRSPHTIDLYDFGRTEDGAFYYVMELLDGMNLEDLVRQYGPLPPERAAFLLAQVCDSLADAHASRLMHRDVKPANIFACRLGRRHDYVNVLDFGLVKTVSLKPELQDDREALDVANLTGEFAWAGTPDYTAPEASMAPSAQDHRGDLYALGCVAYWLLTGTTVFKSSTPVAAIVNHVRSEVERPSERLGEPLPQALEEFVMQCLEKDPTKRPDGAAQLQMELSSLATTWTPARAEAWWTKHVEAVEAPKVSRSRHPTAMVVATPSDATPTEPDADTTRQFKPTKRVGGVENIG